MGIVGVVSWSGKRVPNQTFMGESVSLVRGNGEMMGDGADDALDMELDSLDIEEEDGFSPSSFDRHYTPKRTHWVTRMGERVRISEMTNSHLRNTIRMLQRRVSVEAEWPELVEEARERELEWE